jgi:hypothetical protein
VCQYASSSRLAWWIPRALVPTAHLRSEKRVDICQSGMLYPWNQLAKVEHNLDNAVVVTVTVDDIRVVFFVSFWSIYQDLGLIIETLAAP